MKTFLRFLKQIIKKILLSLKITKSITYFERKYPNIKFDKDWYDNLLLKLGIFSCKLEKIKLKDLKCIIFKDGQWQTLPLCQSPVFQYFSSEDKQSYIEYNEISNEQTDDSHSVEKFENLIKSLDETGYDSTNPICVNKNNGIIDGQHRASYLLNKYGDDYEISVFKIYYF
mgnify:CR=1 FL=1